MIIIENDSIIYKLGKNAKENFELIDNSLETYWWFHLDDYPSGHCIIESSSIDYSMALIAAKLVKENSKVKTEKNIKVVYTQLKNIKKTKNLGEVLILKKPNIITL